jgi:hypothetical protein
MDNPRIISIAPIRNLINVGVSSGVIVKLRIRTIITIGSTENRTSFNLSVITFKKFTSFPHIFNTIKKIKLKVASFFVYCFAKEKSFHHLKIILLRTVNFIS